MITKKNAQYKTMFHNISVFSGKKMEEKTRKRNYEILIAVLAR